MGVASCVQTNRAEISVYSVSGPFFGSKLSFSGVRQMRKGIRLLTAIGVGTAIFGVATARVTKALEMEREGNGDGVPLLEYFQDGPLFGKIPQVSPRGINTFAAFTSVQINVNASGQNIVNDAANEPSFCVDPTNPNRMAVGWRQFNNKSSNFRQAGWAYTTNHGASWTFPGILENNVFRSDPVLASDGDGKFFYLSLMQTFFCDIWQSVNFGVNFTRIASAVGGDKQWFTIDNTNGIGRGNMYQSWSTAGNNWGGRQFSRSVDGGATWTNPIFIPNDMVWGTLDTNSAGDLYLCGTDGGDQFYFARSTNAKDANQAVSFDLSRTLSLNGFVIFGAPVNPDGLGGQVWISCDKSGGPTNGYLYVLASVDPTGDPADVMLSRSTDGGNSWSAPKRINDDPTGNGKYQWFGTLSVAPNGRVDVCWYDTRNSANNTNSELWYTYSTDGGNTFAPNIKVSNPFNHSLGYPNQNKIGDYIGMHSDNGGADIIYSATFNGEQDVYYVRVEALPETAVPDSIAMVQGTAISGGNAELANNDSTYFVSQVFYNPIAPGDPLRFDVTTHTTKRTPSGLQFKFDGRVNAGGLTQKLSLFNYQTSAFELLDTRPAPTADATVTINGSGDLSRFINQSTGEMKARIAYAGFNPVSLNWRANSDQVNWIITP